jgi:hypothetical protein
MRARQRARRYMDSGSPNNRRTSCIAAKPTANSLRVRHVQQPEDESEQPSRQLRRRPRPYSRPHCRQPTMKMPCVSSPSPRYAAHAMRIIGRACLYIGWSRRRSGAGRLKRGDHIRRSSKVPNVERCLGERSSAKSPQLASRDGIRRVCRLAEPWPWRVQSFRAACEAQWISCPRLWYL